MARIKLTKSAVDAAKPHAQAIGLRDTVVPGFLCKITPAGRKVFMLQYRTNAGERRKPALGQYGELTVEQARVMAQEWLAEVRPGRRPQRGQECRPQGADHEGVLPHLHGGLFQAAANPGAIQSGAYVRLPSCRWGRRSRRLRPRRSMRLNPMQWVFALASVPSDCSPHPGAQSALRRVLPPARQGCPATARANVGR